MTYKSRVFGMLVVMCLVFFSEISFGQLTQTVRGVVLDNETKFPLIGVNVIILDTDPLIGNVADVDGKFRLTNVPIGRHNIKFSSIGYGEVVLDNVIVTSGKEVILNVDMEQTVTEIDEIVITANKTGEAQNEMAVLSAREFSVYETEKYAGSRGDPARMAKSYAGVLSSDDSRNDIVIRGNTPQGVLWRMDGVNIPNPNHFAIPGTGGGPVTILNNKFLANSDFFTGAFPAEFSNGIAGVFDLKMRNGNNEHFEGSGQFGFLGIEAVVEGPLSKKGNSSFLAMYKLSTVSVFKLLNISLGTDSSPFYQDAAFRLNFPLKSGGNIAVFGLGGDSNVEILISEKTDTSDFELYGDNDRDQYFGSRMGLLGVSYTRPIDRNTFIKTTFAASRQSVYAIHDKIGREIKDGKFKNNNLGRILNYEFVDNKYSGYISMNKKINRRLSFKGGINVDMFDLKYVDSVRAAYLNDDNTALDSITPWKVRWNGGGNPILIQPYLQFKYKASDNLVFTGGITSNIFTMSENSNSYIEPRLGMSYKLDKKQKINLGMGLHSQTLAPYLYYYDKNDSYSKELHPYNKDLKLLKSLHVVLGYERYFRKDIRFRTEVYYQYLYDLPIKEESSSYSLLNSGTGFYRFFPDELISEGTGRNYGIDITLEKSFSKGYYFMMSGSLFDSKYKGSDGILRNSSFNGRYGVNLLAGKEFKFGSRRTLNVAVKIARAGGHRYGDLDLAKSELQQEIIYKDENYNKYQFRDYFRTDIKISYKLNTKIFTHEFGIDLSNVFNTKNISSHTFVSGTDNPIHEEYQLGMLPIFYYRFDF